MTHAEGLALNSQRTIPWTDELPSGLAASEIHFGRDDLGTGEAQVAVASASQRPTKAALEAAWKTRGPNTTAPVLVVAVHNEGAWLYEHGSDPVGPIPTAQAGRRVQSVLNEPDSISAFHQIRALIEAFQTPGGGGFTNHFLFAGYHLRNNVPQRSDWTSACAAAEPLLTERGKDLIQSLGFQSEAAPGANNALVLRAASGQRRALAVLLTENESFDLRSAAYPLSPVARGLELAGREGVPWVILLRRGTLRLYPGNDGVGVGQRGQSETYFELNLDLLDADDAGYLSLIFSAAALERGGTTDDLLEGSTRFAAELGSRLRDRVYERAVPGLAVGIAKRLPARGVPLDTEGLQFAYALTLRALFRVLFQAYAEDSGLLPADRNEWFKANSLQAFVAREKDTPQEDFSPDATSIWQDLRQVWDAIYSGNPRWEVPAYGGSLFDPNTEEGTFLKSLDLPDAVVGPALQAILTEETEEGVRGAVDFRSLQVREFGTIYEGLLESSLSVAQQNLALTASGSYVPAGPADAVNTAAGEPYFHSASGERKATGSYFTPKIVVDHLIERSVQPALTAHLAEVKELLADGRDRDAAEKFWDFRVADLAMGSAHFLVAAIDKVERGMRDFLTVDPVPGVMAELSRLAERAKEALGGDTAAASAITQAQLLRRQIARRCIYGLDINPLAVELSRLAIWIHTFVPGLPMSSLDHGLVLGNSLTGIGSVDEALDALEPARAPGQATFFDDIILDALAAARTRLADFAAASEADKAEVAAGAQLLAEARAESARAKKIFDAAVAVRIGEVPQQAVISEAALEQLVNSPAVAEVAARVSPAHMPYLFPEVFIRDNPGFDALVGNPPWEELMVEEPKFWLRVRPGLLGLKPAELKAEVARLRAERADLLPELEREIASVAAMRKVLLVGPYPGLGTGDIDLYQAFAWRYEHLTRDRGGRFAVLLPRSIVMSAGSEQWRRTAFTEGTATVTELKNSRGWLFPDVAEQYTVVALVVARGESPIGQIRLYGPYRSAAEFTVENAGARITFEAVAAASKTAMIPSFANDADIAIFALMRLAPSLGERRPGWDVRPVAEFHATNDRATFDAGERRPGLLSVVGGAGFDIWRPETGEVYAWADPATVTAALQAKRQRQINLASAAFYGLPISWSSDIATLPIKSPRIAIRDVARATDTRTTIAALVPPNVGLTNTAPYLVFRDGGARASAYLLGVLCSIPLDWYARKYVELHMNFHILKALPIPTPDIHSLRVARIIGIAGRLAAVDDRYATWAEEVGVPVGSVTDAAMKDDLIAELDALVCLLYCLSEDQVRHIFATFHRGWNFQPRLDAVLAHYRNWESKQ